MADIRINALATTAASTASDDFIAVDGSANGTRKLNAFSPTFGGNLTVSGGTGTIDATGGTASATLNLVGRSSGTAKTASVLANSAGSLVLGAEGAGSSLTIAANTGNTTVAYNLTVSGTGTHSLAGQVTSTVNAANTANIGSFVASNATLNSFTSYSPSASLDQKYWTWQAGTAVGDGTIRLRALNDAQTNGTNALTITRTGISSTAVQVGGNLTVSGGTITSGSGTLTLNSSANTVVLQSAGTTALTLDSSQNATFAGSVTLNNNGIYQSSTTAVLRSNATNASCYVRANGTGKVIIDTGAGLDIQTGSLQLPNAYQAATVVPTGYVTIKDSTGTTYKVCVLL